MRTEAKSHAWRMIGLSLISAILAIAVTSMDRAHLIPGFLRPLAALFPVISLVGFFVGFSRWLRGLDELQRMIHLRRWRFSSLRQGCW